VKIKEIRIGQCVRHPSYDGTGDVTRIEPNQVEVFFNQGKMTLGLEEIEKLIALDTVDTSHLDIRDLIEQSVTSALRAAESQTAESSMAKKFRSGKMVIHPADASLSGKEIDLETFFHKIVMVRDNLRVLEQKINSHKGITEQEKVELQQYLTRMAGSLTTFNGLFRDKDEYF
jgi:hypothetical protein